MTLNPWHQSSLNGFASAWCRHSALLLTTFAVALMVCAAAWAAIEIEPEITNTTTPDHILGKSKMVVFNARFSGNLKKDSSYVLTAAEARQDADNDDLILFRSISASLISDKHQSKEWIVLTAARGSYDRANDLFFLDDGVRMRTHNGYEGEAENLYFMPSVGHAWSDSDVTFDLDGVVLKSRRFDFDNHNAILNRKAF